MKVLRFFLSLAVVKVALATPFSTSDDDDRIKGTAVINMAKRIFSSDTRTDRKQNNSSLRVSLKIPHSPTVALGKTKPPKVEFPSHPEVISPRVLHPQNTAHHVIPELNDNINKQSLVHYIDKEGHHHHLDVFQLSNGLQVVPLDDKHGHITDYLYLGTEINLVPGSGTFYLPATDPVDDHTAYVNLDTESGHLSLSEVTIGNTVQQGFEGVDDISPVFIPVEKKFQRLVVNPVIYRTYYKTPSSFSQFRPTLPKATTYPSHTSSVGGFHQFVF